MIHMSSEGFSQYSPVVYHPALSSIASLVETCSPKYSYTLYLAYDYEDKLFDFDERRKEFRAYVRQVLGMHLGTDGIARPDAAACDIQVDWTPIMLAASLPHKYDLLARRAYARGADYFLALPPPAHLRGDWAPALVDALQHGHPAPDADPAVRARALAQLAPGLAAAPSATPAPRRWPGFGAACLALEADAALQHVPALCLVSRVHLELHQGSLFPAPHGAWATAVLALYHTYTPWRAAPHPPRAQAALWYRGPSVGCADPVYEYLLDAAFVLDARKTGVPCRDLARALLAHARPFLTTLPEMRSTAPAPAAAPIAASGLLGRARGVVSPGSSVVGPFEADLLAQTYTAAKIDEEVALAVAASSETLRVTEVNETYKRHVVRARLRVEALLRGVAASLGGQSSVVVEGERKMDVSDCISFVDHCD